MASLCLLDLQMERFDIALDFFDPLDNLFFKNLLPSFGIRVGLDGSSSLSKLSLQLRRLALCLCVSKRAHHVCGTCRIRWS